MRPLCGVAVPVSDTNTLPWFERAIPIGRLSPDVTVVPGHNCACAGVSRAEPSIDIIQEVQIQSVGVSAEYGNIQGTVFNVVTMQGSNRLLYDASYYAQASSLTAQPVLLPVPASQSQSGYERARYRDFTTNLAVLCVAIDSGSLALSALAGLRQSTGHRPGVPKNLRTGQGLREAHVAPEAGPAADAEFSRRVLGQPSDSDSGDAIRRDHAPERIRADDHLRPSDTYVVGQHGLGCTSRTLRVFAERRPE